MTFHEMTTCEPAALRDHYASLRDLLYNVPKLDALHARHRSKRRRTGVEYLNTQIAMVGRAAQDRRIDLFSAKPATARAAA